MGITADKSVHFASGSIQKLAHVEYVRNMGVNANPVALIRVLPRSRMIASLELFGVGR